MLTPPGSRESSRTPRATGPHRGGSRSPPAASQSRSYVVGGRCTTCSCVCPDPCRGSVPCGHGTRPRAGRPRRADRGRGGRRQVGQEARAGPGRGRGRAGEAARRGGRHRPRCRAPGPRHRPGRRGARPGRQRRLPARARLLRVGQDGRRGAHPPRRRPARHRDPRGRSLRHGVRARPRGRAAAAAAPAAVLLRPAPRPVGRRRPVDAARAGRPATSRPARSTSSGCAPAPSPTSAR